MYLTPSGGSTRKTITIHTHEKCPIFIPYEPPKDKITFLLKVLGHVSLHFQPYTQSMSEPDTFGEEALNSK